MRWAIVSIYPANGNVVRPSPVDDLDRSCTPVLFVQDGAGPFYGCVLADRLPSVDPHATFVLARGTGEDDVDAVGGGRGVDPRRDSREDARPLRVSQAPLRGPRRQDRGRGVRGPLARLPADGAARAGGAARGAVADAKRRGALERGDEPDPARDRP